MSLKFKSKTRDQGLHVQGNQAWQMVPVGKSRKVTVKGIAGLMLQVRNTSIIKVTHSSSTTSSVITIEGLKIGRTYIDWVAPKTKVKTGFSLEVSVKKQKIIQTVFHYVDDGRVQKTKRKPGNAATLIKAANKFLTPQTNIKLTLKQTKILKIKRNLGKVVRFSSHIKGVPKSQHDWDAIIAHGDKKADFNVFFVKEYEQDITPLTDSDEAGTIASQKSCILEDKLAYTAGEVLAHETGHLLGISGHSTVVGNLMYGAGSGHHLNKTQANKLNPSGAK